MASKKNFEFRMSKKVAELTQVVHMLFTRNHEKEVEMEGLKEAYEDEIGNIIQDAESRLKEAEDKYNELDLEKSVESARIRGLLQSQATQRDEEMKEKIEKLEQQLSDEKRDCQSVRDLLINAQNDIDRLKRGQSDEVLEKSKALDGKARELHQLRTQVQNLERALKEKETKIHSGSELQKSNDKLNKELSRLRDQIENSDKLKEECVEKNKQLESEIKQLKRELARRLVERNSTSAKNRPEVRLTPAATFMEMGKKKDSRKGKGVASNSSLEPERSKKNKLTPDIYEKADKVEQDVRDVFQKEKRKRKRNKDKSEVLNGSEERILTDSPSTLESQSSRKHKKMKSKDVKESNSDLGSNGEVDMEESISSIGSHVNNIKKKKKKHKKDRVEVVPDTQSPHIETTTTEVVLQTPTKCKKRKRKHAEALPEVDTNGSESLQDELVAVNHQASEDCDGCAKKKKKKRKDHSVVSSSDKDRESSSSPEQPITASPLQEKSKKKKKRKVIDCEEDVDLCETSNSVDFNEDNSVDKKKHKKKKTKKDKKEAADCSVSEAVSNGVNEGDATCSAASSVNPLPSKAADNDSHSGTSSHQFGQWGSGAFTDKERNDKFLRLLGGFKKSGSADAGKKKCLFGSLGMAPQTNTQVSMGVDRANQLNSALEKQYNDALSLKLNQQKGGGLGFAPPPGAGKKFHIETSTKTSTKFEDSD